MKPRDGTVYRARRAVVSNVDPAQTFLQKVGAEHLPPDEVKRVEGWQINESDLFGAHMVLRNPPDYAVAETPRHE